jgi:hypothetical protein
MNVSDAGSTTEKQPSFDPKKEEGSTKSERKY